jgi:hypothetical protein
MKDTEKSDLRSRLSEALRTDQDLQGIVLSDADLTSLDFTGANLRGAFIDGCDLRKSNLCEVNLQDAFAAGALLQNSDLVRAELNGTVFSGASLENAKLLAFSLSFGRVPINLTAESFGQATLFKRPHIDETEPSFSEHTYRALKAYFLALGDYESASWAAYSEKLMQKKTHWEDGRYLDWAVSALFGAACGYGERPVRAITFSTIVILIYAAMYFLAGLIQVSATHSSIGAWDSLYFSACSFVGVSFGEFIPTASRVSRLCVVSECFGGLFAFGLFIFTLTKRYVAR